MKQIFGFIWHRVSSSVSFVDRLVRDRIVEEKEVPTLVGKGLLICQIREGRDGARYVVFRSKGGDATVWNGVSIAEIQSLISFLQEGLLNGRAIEEGNEEVNGSSLRD